MTDRRLLTKRELAEALDCDVRTIAKWQDEGLPVAVRGRGGRGSQYDEAACRAWKQVRDETAAGDEPVDLVRERARLARAQAVLAEQKYAVNARQLLPADEVERAWSAEQAAVRAKLLALPQAFADRLHRAAVKKGVAGADAAIREMVDEVLSELAVMPRPPKQRTA
jgi:phage terminase Nu1 subunit (DNA packaging protein)